MKGVIGIDEVGRGPVAGPVTVCAVYLSDSKQAEMEYFNNIVMDSKMLSKDSRFNIFQIIRKNKENSNLVYAVSSRSAKHVDKHGINKAIHSCMISCLKSLEKKGIKVEELQINLDGGLKIKREGIKQASYIKGDEQFVEIALASIIAKVRRDTYMKRLARLYPLHGFETNVGYGTAKHMKAINEGGLTEYHRMTYLERFLSIRKNLK
jgi:ribonuclease HII